MKYGPLLEVPAAGVFRIWHGRGRTPGLPYVAEVVFHVLTYRPHVAMSLGSLSAVSHEVQLLCMLQKSPRSRKTVRWHL